MLVMSSVLKALENFFDQLPLPLLKVWGQVGYILGMLIMAAAYGKLTFRVGDQWRLGREKHSWDLRAFVGILSSFVLILFTGYIGSFIVLVPGAQTFESIKDLCVFVCILIFGYPALLTVPFAYGLSDLIEGVPPDFLLDWLPGYFINPACFWIGYQLLGKDPDFRKLRTWKMYGLFVAVFMALEPQLWGHICSGKFTPEISYRHITPALFFTTLVTWIIAPFAMLLALPLAKRMGIFWADIPGHVKELVPRGAAMGWESGSQGQAGQEKREIGQPGLPLRMYLFMPMVILVLVMVGTTALITLKSSQNATEKLVRQYHRELATYQIQQLTTHPKKTQEMLDKSAQITHGKSLLVDENLKPLVASRVAANFSVPVQLEDEILRNLKLHVDDLRRQRSVLFKFDMITTRPLNRETWLTLAAFINGSDRIFVSAMPESYYLEGIRKGNSRSAMLVVVSLIFALLITLALTSYVSSPISRIISAIQRLALGQFTKPLPFSSLMEVNTLASAFNGMSQQLQHSISELRISQNRMQIAIQAADFAIWDWDVKSNRIVWDDLMYTQYGLDKNEYVPEVSTWTKFLHPADRDRVLAKLSEMLGGRHTIMGMEFRVIRPSGEVRNIKAMGKGLRDSDGHLERMIGINHDVTQQRSDEAELEKYRAHLEELIELRTQQLMEKDRLATLGIISAGFAHEVKNPLNLILNASKVIEMKLNLQKAHPELDSTQSHKLQEQLEQSNDIILKNSSRLEGLVKTLLMQIRMPNKDEWQDVDLVDVVKTNIEFVLTNYRPKLNNRLIVEIVHADSKVVIPGSPMDLGRMIINTVDNSCYALIKKIQADKSFTGLLRLSVEVKGNRAELRIYDNGVGIPRAHFEQLFTPFFTTKPTGEGTGLGLSFVYDIVRRHGGTAHINSEEDQFTELVIQLPLKEADA